MGKAATEKVLGQVEERVGRVRRRHSLPEPEQIAEFMMVCFGRDRAVAISEQMGAYPEVLRAIEAAVLALPVGEAAEALRGAVTGAIGQVVRGHARRYGAATGEVERALDAFLAGRPSGWWQRARSRGDFVGMADPEMPLALAGLALGQAAEEIAVAEEIAAAEEIVAAAAIVERARLAALEGPAEPAAPAAALERKLVAEAEALPEKIMTDAEVRQVRRRPDFDDDLAAAWEPVGPGWRGLWGG